MTRASAEARRDRHTPGREAVRRVTCCLSFLVLLVSCGTSRARAAKSAPRTPADRVLLVINSRSADSETIGRYYATRRGIAASHIVHVDMPTDDEIGELAFRSSLLTPVEHAIDALPVRIDFIVLTKGIPIRIDGRNGYSVDALLGGMHLPVPPMVGFDSTWLSRYQSPYFDARVPFDSDRFAMYLVTRLDCGQLADCLALVDRSMAAQAVRGPFFLDATPPNNRNDGYAAINRSMYAAAFHLRLNGLDVQLDTTARFVAPAQPVMGYASWGSNDARFDSSAYHAVRFLPGALAETFVSTSARTFGPVDGGQSRIVDLIAQGVTGAKGYVSEPGTIALANPGVIFDRYVRGFTLAESFYAASRMILWKDIVVGDPLCAPYALMVQPPPRE